MKTKNERMIAMHFQGFAQETANQNLSTGRKSNLDRQDRLQNRIRAPKGLAPRCQMRHRRHDDTECNPFRMRVSRDVSCRFQRSPPSCEANSVEPGGRRTPGAGEKPDDPFGNHRCLKCLKVTAEKTKVKRCDSEASAVNSTG
jgi:hypothetical protein